MKKNSFKLNLKKFILSIIVVLLIIAGICAWISKGNYNNFLKYFIISVLVFIGIIFLCVFAVFNDNRVKRKSKKNLKHTRKYSNAASLVIKSQRNKKRTPNSIKEDNWLIDLKKSINKQTQSEYVFPPFSLLEGDYISKYEKEITKYEKELSEKLQKILLNYKIRVSVKNIIKGPNITRIEIEPNLGVKVSKIVGLTENIIQELQMESVRIEMPDFGKTLLGVEIPNQIKEKIFFKELIVSNEFQKNESILTIALGKDIKGNNVIADISKMPNLLIAGEHKSGKSICIHSIILSLLFKVSPGELNIVLIDLKVMELSMYNGIPHLMIPVVTKAEKAYDVLRWAVNEMKRRKKIFLENEILDIESYNKKVKKETSGEKLERIVIIIDEYEDLMFTKNNIESTICIIAQNARNVGIHLVISTQRTSYDVITGLIKTNFPTRIAFSVSSQIDSKIIIDERGADKLLGDGDMLFYRVGQPKLYRVKGVMVTQKELERILSYLKMHMSVKYEEKINKKEINGNIKEEDEIFKDVVEFVLKKGYASIPLIQRYFRISYSRAAYLLEVMKEKGIIHTNNGNKNNEVILNNEKWEINKDEIIK